MEDTRDVALKALTTIENHIQSCDNRYKEIGDRQDKTLVYLQEITRQIGGLKEDIAEARGAGKMAKFITGAASGVMGFLGGLGSHIVIK